MAKFCSIWSHCLQLLQHQDQDLQAIFQFLKNGQWHTSLTKQKIRVLTTLTPKVFFDKNKLAPFELLFGICPQLSSLPTPEIQCQHYSESFPAEQLQLLQHACQVACQTAEAQGKK